MNLTRNQIIAIIIAVLSVLVGSTAQLTELIGAKETKVVIALATIGNTVLASILSILTSQTSQVKEVLAMPGIEKVTVNAQATSALAAVAVDAAQPKIAPTTKDIQTVAEIAKG